MSYKRCPECKGLQRVDAVQCVCGHLFRTRFTDQPTTQPVHVPTAPQVTQQLLQPIHPGMDLVAERDRKLKTQGKVLGIGTGVSLVLLPVVGITLVILLCLGPIGWLIALFLIPLMFLGACFWGAIAGVFGASRGKPKPVTGICPYCGFRVMVTPPGDNCINCKNRILVTGDILHRPN